MSLDGLRAWVGEVERKLGMRTRVFLVLVAIAIAGAAAGIYLALDAADQSVSKDEVRALQERVEAAGAAAGATSGETAAVAALKAEVETLRNQVSELEKKGRSSGAGTQGSSGAKTQGNSPAAADGGSGGAGTEGKRSSSEESVPRDKDEVTQDAKSANEPR